MAKAIFSSEAEQDLRQIVEFIARDSQTAALSWLEATRETCVLLATRPEIGQQVQTGRLRNVRRRVVGNYLIYYQPHEADICIVRILHGARDQQRLI